MARVLLIDDDLLLSRLITEHLTNEGHEVTTAYMVEEGFQKAMQSPPDLILLDVMLPDATGFQACGKFRQETKTQHTPIIMMSGTARSSSQQTIGRQMGANDYILKPFNIIEVGDKVQALLSEMPSDEEPKRAMGDDRISSYGSVQPIELDVISKAPDHDAFPVLDLSTTPVDYTKPAFEEIPAISLERLFSIIEKDLQVPPAPVRNYAWGIFVSQLLVAVAGSLRPFLLSGPAGVSWSELLRSLLLVTNGWVVFLSLLMSVTALLKISLNSKEALNILGLSAAPIVLRSLLNLVSLRVTPDYPPAIFWLRPLDLFEMAALVIMALVLRRQTGSSREKCLWAIAAMALAWTLAGRGYSHIF